MKDLNNLMEHILYQIFKIFDITIIIGLLLKTGLPLIGNVLKPLAKSVLTPLGLTAAASATDTAIHKKIMKILKSLEDSGLIIKGVNETIKNEAKEQRGGFLRMLLGTLGASLLENLLTCKGTTRAGEGTNRAGEKC